MRLLRAALLALTLFIAPTCALAGIVLATPLLPANALPGFTNWGPQSVQHLIADIAGVTTNGTKTGARWVIVSDSTGAGHCADGACVNNRLHSWPAQLAASMSAAGIPTNSDSFFGCSNVGTTAACTTLDSRVTFGASWVLLGQVAFGGNAPNFPASTAPTALTFTGATAYNQADVFVLNGTATSSITVDRAGSAPTSASVIATTGTACTVSLGTITTTNGTPGVCELRFNWGTTATGALNIQAANSATGKFYVSGAAERDTANPKIEIYNLSIGGSTTANWAASAFQYGPAVPLTAAFINPSVTFNGLGINSWVSAAESVSTFQTNQQTMQTTAHVTGDNIFIFATQSDPAQVTAPVASQQQYGAVLQALAANGNDPVIDFQYRWGTWANASARGFMGGTSFNDARHPSAKGYSDDANMIMSGIRRVGQ